MPIINYLKDVRAELKHVTWPTRSQTILYTVVVVLVSVGVAVYLGLFDYLFSTLLKQII
jgi:preprotein translocase subunit SecE